MEVRRLLMIDDERPVRELVVAQLRGESYEITCAAGAQEGLALLEREKFDVIVCDVMMPGMDGFEFCRRIKAHDEWRFTPVILLTALDGQDDLIRGLEAGADEFLSKPVERIVLRARVAAMVRVRENYDRLRARASDIDGLLRERRDQLSRDAKLSPREREVLDLLLLGRTHDDIGIALGITARTSKFHQENVLKKLGADSRHDLVRLFL